MSLPRSLKIRVYYEDTDFSGVVYHASYLRFMERGRTEFLRDLGIHQHMIHSGTTDSAPFAFAVRSMTLEFLKASVMDDVLDIVTEVSALKGASALLRQRVERAGIVLVTAEVRVAAVADGRAVRFPENIRVKLAGQMKDPPP